MKDKKITSLTIDRSKWGFGTNGGSLLGDDGKMCCLGFISRKAGFKPCEILGIEMPSTLNNNFSVKTSSRIRKLKFLLNKIQGNAYEDTDICCMLAQINDNDSEKMTQTKRENGIIENFAKLGVKVKFVGKVEE